MRLLYFCPRYLPVLSGGELAAHGLAAALVRRGHEVCIVTSSQAPDRRTQRLLDGVRILHGRIRPTIRRYVEDMRPDVLLAQFEMSLPTIEFAVSARLPVAISCHGPFGFTEVAEAGLASAVDLFVFNSTFLANLANRNVNHVVVSPPIDRRRVLAPAGLERRFVTIVSLFVNKGPHVFYALARAFPERRFLGIAGGYGEQQHEELPNVEHRRNTAEMSAVFGETGVLLLPSGEESFGMAAVEAQANGVPVIASDLPSLRESLGDGALFVPREDIDAWANALRSLDDPALYDALSRRARANADRYDIDRDVATLDAVLDGIVRRHRWRRRPSVNEFLVEREERGRRIREIFHRAHGRAPTVAELGFYLDGATSLRELEVLISQLRG